MTTLYNLFRLHPHISTDSRRIEPDSLFFALKGASFDGNRFAADALAKGAAYAVVDDASLPTQHPDLNDRLVVVEDVLQALQALAPDGRERGLLAGANVIMPNIGDVSHRKDYLLYDNKPGTDENAAESRERLERAIAGIGERIGYGEWGDSPHFQRRTSGSC